MPQLEAKKIKRLRNEKGYSQEKLAQKSGLGLRTIQRIEQGNSKARGDTLRLLAEVLEVEIKDLIEEKKHFRKTRRKLFRIFTRFTFSAYKCFNFSVSKCFGFLDFMDS